MERFVVREENGIYDVDMYKDDNEKPVGGVTIDTVRNHYYAILPSEYNTDEASYLLNPALYSSNNLPESIKTEFINKVAVQIHKNAKHGDTKSYTKEIMKNIIRNNPNIDFMTYGEEAILNAYANELKEYHNGNISENMMLR